MAEVVEFTGITSLPIDPERILESAKGKLQRVIVIGIDMDGEEYVASSDPDCGTSLWDIERAKLRLLRTAD